ncbi:MAG: sodium:proton antiporter [Gammaproteobacteria bacterium]|nr:MAG: sodium:proton antiporter [Gammaproteobacteria bacterium]
MKKLIFLLTIFVPFNLYAVEVNFANRIDLTGTTLGLSAIAIFIIAYLVVMSEEFTHLRKSKPVILAAGIMWAMLAYYYAHLDPGKYGHTVEEAVRHNILEYAELFLFLLVAMTYINTMNERNIFKVLKVWLIKKGFSYRQLFWVTGWIAFFVSPVADNLTTALLMCAVVLAVGKHNAKFISIACINIVVAANAGGAFSPFGDITTLMVWQKGIVPFSTFFLLFVPSVVNFLIPAIIMHFFIPQDKPTTSGSDAKLKRGAIFVIFLFLITISFAVSFHSYLHLPPVIGMMTGFSLLQFFGFYLKKTKGRYIRQQIDISASTTHADAGVGFDIFNKVSRAEWDTLLFFYGVVLCVGALGVMGYLTLASNFMYQDLGATNANILVGILSAIIDNIPVMFAVLTMNPEMSTGQWLLVTLTAGVGGSLLSIGSAAGVALMGLARGKYTFFGHLKWTPVIALGYAGSIVCHLWINNSLF